MSPDEGTTGNGSDFSPPCGSAGPTLEGHLRRLPPSFGWRVIQVLSLVYVLRATFEGIARVLFRYRSPASLRLSDKDMELSVVHSVFGTPIRRSRRVFPIAELQEIAFDKKGEHPAWTVGMIALCLGTIFGVWLLGQGLGAGAGGLVLAGSAVVALSVALDYFLGSGRELPELSGKPQLTVHPKHRGFSLDSVEEAAAEEFLRALRERLTAPRPCDEHVSAET